MLLNAPNVSVDTNIINILSNSSYYFYAKEKYDTKSYIECNFQSSSEFWFKLSSSYSTSFLREKILESEKSYLLQYGGISFLNSSEDKKFEIDWFNFRNLQPSCLTSKGFKQSYFYNSQTCYYWLPYQQGQSISGNMVQMDNNWYTKADQYYGVKQSTIVSSQFEDNKFSDDYMGVYSMITAIPSEFRNSTKRYIEKSIVNILIC